jgi:NAD(P)-dependent dehydrogenase (short-subunit alcohol dehydrogenase family)
MGGRWPFARSGQGSSAPPCCLSCTAPSRAGAGFPSETHEQRFGRLDVLVNNAGALLPGPLTAVPVPQLDSQLASNLRSAWLVTAAAVPLLQAAGGEHGRALIVNTSSIVGRYPQPRAAAYSASKAALFALSQSTQQELAASGVRVTTLAPAFVATPMTEPLPLDPEDLIGPEDVAEAVRFLTRRSARVVIPELQMLRPADRLLAAM